ncbi:MAG: glycosyltransferase [Deltaproteobacteria bacterium]|nr:glycosyltransferase [Deltaproteobacteria bacterium]
MDLVAWILAGIVGVSLAAYASGVGMLLRRTRRGAQALSEPEVFPSLSIIKPIKGTEEDLEANLETFFRQDYPGEMEIVVGSLEPDDPGLDVARRVAARHPEVRVRFVAGGPVLGLNPKVSNLANLTRVARFDLVLFSDANVRVGADYCRRIVGEMEREGGSLLTSLVAGVGERSMGAAMDNQHLTGFISPAMCFALVMAGITCVVGKTMLLRRSELEGLGGFDLVKDILAEDFVLGAAYQSAGKRVLLSPTPVFNVNVRTSVDRFMSRHARWLKMRAVLHVPGMLADLGANPIMLAALSVLATGARPISIAALAIASLAKPIGDAVACRRLRGASMALRYLALVPLKDILIGAVWPYALVSRTIEWRGVRLHIGKGSVLRPLHEPLALPLPRR